MSNDEEPTPTVRRSWKSMLLGVLLLVTALGGAVIARLVSPMRGPSNRQASASGPPRPIVQIVRPQSGLPDVSDLVDRVCPSIAVIVPRGASGTDNPSAVPATAYAADGWLVTSADDLPQMPLNVIFGDGRRAEVEQVRTDYVSGLAVVKSSAAAAPLAFSNQAFPRVGQFGLELETAGNGCKAEAQMIGSDFLTDGASGTGYVRLRPAPDDWTAGAPLLGPDGIVIGIAVSDPAGAIIPAPIADIIIAELIRNNVSASVDFGFRAIDYSAPMATRLGNVRSGAGVAMVEVDSSAARAGLRAGDIITAIDNQPISSAAELGRALDGASGTVVISVQRQTQALTINLKRRSR